MENKKISLSSSIIAGILFSIYGLYTVFANPGENKILFLVLVVGLALLIYSAFAEKKGMLVPIGYALLLVRIIIMIFSAEGVLGVLAIIFSILGFIVAMAMSFVFTSEAVTQYGEKVRPFWFAPAVLLLVAMVLNLIADFSVAALIFEIIFLAACLFDMMWLAEPEGKFASILTVSDAVNATVSNTVNNVGVTVADALKSAKAGVETAKAGVEAKLETAKAGIETKMETSKAAQPQNLAEAQKIMQAEKEAQAQKTAQKLFAKPANKTVTTPATAQLREEITISYGVAEELRIYKQLLDEEIITQDEYRERKKRILNKW